MLPRAIAQAEIRAQAAGDDLAIRHPGLHTPVTTSADHVPPAITHEHPLPGSGPHDAPLAAPDAVHPPPTGPVVSGPAFTLENPLDHMTRELRVLSEQHLTGSGETVIGPFAPRGGGLSYIDFAEQRGASYFDIGEAWNLATDTQRLAANQHVLDIAIANRDTITLSVPIGKIGPNTFTGAEIRYLESHGYQRTAMNTLVPPTRGRP